MPGDLTPSDSSDSGGDTMATPGRLGGCPLGLDELRFPWYSPLGFSLARCGRRTDFLFHQRQRMSLPSALRNSSNKGAFHLCCSPGTNRCRASTEALPRACGLAVTSIILLTACGHATVGIQKEGWMQDSMQSPARQIFATNADGEVKYGIHMTQAGAAQGGKHSAEGPDHSACQPRRCVMKSKTMTRLLNQLPVSNSELCQRISAPRNMISAQDWTYLNSLC